MRFPVTSSLLLNFVPWAHFCICWVFIKLERECEGVDDLVPLVQFPLLFGSTQKVREGRVVSRYSPVCPHHKVVVRKGADSILRESAPCTHGAYSPPGPVWRTLSIHTNQLIVDYHILGGPLEIHVN